MIRDTSAQDRLVEVKSNPKRRLVLIGVGVAVVALLALFGPRIGRLFSADASVSSSRLAFATVERGPFVRDIAAEGKVVAAVSPTLYATYGGAVTLKVHAGDAVKKGQVLAVIDSPELTNKLAQEMSAADAMQVDYLRAQIDARKTRGELQKAYDNANIDDQGAQRDLARYQKAFTLGAVPSMDVDKSKDALQKANITLAHAKADLATNTDSLNFDIQSKKLAHDRQLLLVKDLQRQVEDLNVKSPVDGQVGQLFIAERATVAKDAQLVSVIDLSALEVEMKVPESFARDLGIGMTGEISGNGATWKGLVSAISMQSQVWPATIGWVTSPVGVNPLRWYSRRAAVLCLSTPRLSRSAPVAKPASMIAGRNKRPIPLPRRAGSTITQPIRAARSGRSVTRASACTAPAASSATSSTAPGSS